MGKINESSETTYLYNISGIISDIPLPDNLHLTVSKDVNRDRALLSLLLSDRFKYCKSIIVYCTRREECERIASFLRTGLKSEVVVESTNKVSFVQCQH